MKKSQKEIFKEIKKEIDKSKKILLLTHRAPDGDGIGAILALYDYFKKRKKKVFVFSNNPPYYLSFLKNYTQIKKSIPPKEKFDLILALDYADDRRIDLPPNLNIKKEKIISIDHHLDAKIIGDLSFVDSKASSVCEIIYDFLKFLKAKITIEMANALLTGIFTDTVGFERVFSRKTKKIIVELLSKGAEIEKIVNSYYNITLFQAKLLEKILSRIKEEEDLKLIYSWLSFSDFSEIKKEFKNKKESSELFLQEPPIFPDFLARIGSADVYLFLIKLKKDKIKASLRSRTKKINLAKIAEKKGGGGHKEAAGFFMKGSLKEAIDFVKEEIKKVQKK